MDDLDQMMKDVEEKERRGAPAPEPIASAPKPLASIMDEEPHSGVVPFGTFASMDLRVGKIIEVSDHPGARKPMYILRVDLGEMGIRTIVAGIKSYYTPEDLIGRNIVVVTNLEQRKIAGVLSEGMLLAGEDGDKVSLLQPDRDMRAGSKIG